MTNPSQLIKTNVREDWIHGWFDFQNSGIIYADNTSHKSWKTKYYVRLPILYLAGQASVHILTTSVQCKIFAKPAWMSVGQSFRTLDCLEMAISRCSRRIVIILNGTRMAGYNTEWQIDCGPVLWMREGEMDWQTTDKPLVLGGDQLEKLKTVIHVLIP